jgi:2-polyprenyl-6-hydroxyphenyl methylase/3-demethylubiquinone-9 3-methyltransferase
MSSTIDLKEIEKFSSIADEWWNETGKFKPLHKFNPIRISFIRKKIIEHFLLDNKSLTPFSGLKILDIGCGGGLIAEPFSRMKADLTAIDASEKNIQVAKIHAEKSGLSINYLVTCAEDFAQKDEKFDVVFALEIIEHVADVENFISSCAKLLKPKGLLFVATMNRTIKSLAFAKFAAEYILQWLPRGTHDWRKFLKPSEVNFYAEKENLKLSNLVGFKYNLLQDEWKECNDLSINYAAMFVKNP